jgi:glucose-1-phosphate thymidylyltransferase
MSGYVGVILAAGRGTRMGSLGQECPKALLPVGNRPLIEHHLEALRDADIRDVFLVVGHRGDRIEDAVGDGGRHGVRVGYVEQGTPLGSAHAVGRLADRIDSRFVLLLGDYYLSGLDLPRLLQRSEALAASVLVAKREANREALLEACVLDVDADGRVVSVVEKPKVPRGELKGCGVSVLGPEIFDAVRRTPRTMLRDEYELMVSLDIHVRDGNPLHAEVVDSWDVNITRPSDLLGCNLSWLAESGRTELIGEDVQLAEGSRLERAVIGDGVSISEPSVLTEAVVFGGVELEGGGAFEKVIITPGGLTICA